MRVVTGAGGFVGSLLVRVLAERHGRQSVRALDIRKPAPSAAPGIGRVMVDIRDKPKLKAAFDGAEVVHHAAGAVSLDSGLAGEGFATNVAGTRNVVDSAIECGVRRLVHYSSVHAYDQSPRDELLDETRCWADSLQHDPYDRSKADGEKEVRRGADRGLDAVILNPTGLFGPFDHGPSHMGQFFIDLYHRRFPVLIAGGFDWVDVRDVVAAAVAAEDRGRSGENYILSGSWHSLRELAQFSERATGVPAPRVALPKHFARLWVPFQTAWDPGAGPAPALHAIRH